jgi:NitT/TauT family transport system permease protein
MPERTGFGRILRMIGFFAATLIAWEVAVRLLHIPEWLVPSPLQIVTFISEKHAMLFYHALFTMGEAVVGFALALVCGVAFGIGIIHFPMLRDTLYPLLIMLNSFPKIAIAPLFVIWIGVGIESKIANAFLLALFPIVINAILGLTNMEEDLLQLVQAMSRSRWVLFWKIRLPHSLPYLFAACKIAISFAIIGAIVGEFISGRAGLGYLILAANSYFNTPMAFAALAYLVGTSLILYGLVVLAQKIVLPWYHREV